MAIDEKLIEEARKVGNHKTMKDVVNHGAFRVWSAPRETGDLVSIRHY
jgi:hypothetical protein